MTDSDRPTPPPSLHWPDALAVGLLLALVVLFFRRLLFTNLILVRGDMFLYFYPYWEMRNAALSAHTIPHWNPLLFTGVPFLANSQAGVLYPLNWPLAGLDAPTAIKMAAVLHAGLTAIGTYLFGRRGLRLSMPAALLAGLTFAFGGYFTAQLEHINQFQGLAWLPWVFWLFGEAHTGSRRALPGLGIVFALQILAGHTQTVFISGVGLGTWALWHSLRPWPFRHLPGEATRPRLSRTLRAFWPVGLVVLGALLAAALAAAQLLPTLELARLSNRGDGLPFREALSFSLRPHLLGRAFLPNYSAEPLFTEYVAYVGILSLMLAAAGLWSERRRWTFLGLGMLATLGLFFAAGAYNPVYWGLVRFVPGFGLFRVPARWLALTALALAGLAGVGFDSINRIGDDSVRRIDWLALGGPILGVGLLVGASFLAARLRDIVPGASIPAPPELIRWALTGLLGVLLLFAGQRRLLPGALLAPLAILLITGELYLASANQPFNDLSAPSAWTSQRPAISTMLATQQDMIVPDRYLSLSDTLFDPGDLRELQSAFRPFLDDDALFDFVVATKQQEILAPNLSMHWDIPALDGFDGGILPLRAFTRYTELFAVGESSSDGRLREYLDSVPDLAWLRPANVRWIITDKVLDAWTGNVYYDLQFPQEAVSTHSFIAHPQVPFEATAVGLIAYTTGDIDPRTVVGQLEVTSVQGESRFIDLLSGDHIAGASAADRQPALIGWSDPAMVQSIAVRFLPDVEAVVVQGMSLIDERTGAFVATTLSSDGAVRLAHSGDVKVYEDGGAQPRAYLVCQPFSTTDEEEAFTWLAEHPNGTVLTTDVPFAAVAHCDAANPGQAEIVSYTPERVVVRVSTDNDTAYLILADAWYPGWTATDDGEPANVFRANGLFRAVQVPRGEHEIVFTYSNRPFHVGAVVSIVFVLITLGLVIFLPDRSRPDLPSIR